MSRSTPRKSRHRQQPSSGRQQIQASDYESDTAYYMETRDMAPQPPSQTRSDLEINLSVLRRHDPTILSIRAIAANAVIYTFLETTGGWEKHGIEGTLFVCEQQPVLGSLGQPKPNACVFVLNRRGMNNLILDLSRVSDCEVVEELVVFRLEDGYSPNSAGLEDGTANGTRVLGIWMHSDETRPREANMGMIQTAWQEARSAPVMQATVDETASVVESQVGGAALTGPVAGRHPCCNSLLHQQPKTASDRQMAKAPSKVSDSTQNSVISDDEIATALQRQLSLVSAFDEWLQQHIDAEKDHQRIASVVKNHNNSYKEWLLAAQSDPCDVTKTLTPWEMNVTVEHGRRGGSIIGVTGPAPADVTEIEAEDEEKADYILSDQYLGYMTKMCHAFSDAQKGIQSLLKIAHEVVIEKTQLSQPAEVTVQAHIRRLKDYNDMKDIGQQLIGLIAENRGIPIGGLYEDGQYGITADD
ncbi:hypothetical protein QBC44DRAFT_357095 [Cladorrhinum sp. PSN332]|nr:hypothetical protein QBC44DRAFT_357095 [Cladorrhinum sp. PSN332]